MLERQQTRIKSVRVLRLRTHYHIAFDFELDTLAASARTSAIEQKKLSHVYLSYC